MVQRKVLVPIESPETLVLAKLAFEKVPVPEITVHSPDPIIGEFAERVVTVEQIVWSFPVLGESGFSCTLMVILSEDAAHTPFEIVHLKTLFPMESPDTPEVGEVALTKIAVPEIMVQIPFPMDGEFAERVVTVEQIVWSVPAFAAVGAA